MRTFIAIDFDERIKDRLSSFLRELERVSQNIRWVKPEGMHLTLKFLGEVEEEKISGIESALDRIASAFSPFTLQLRGAGTFPHGRKSPRVIWVGIHENPILKSLQAKIEAGFEELGFPKEKREFHPHLTLGRVKAHSLVGGIFPLLEKNKESDFGKMDVRKITLFKSLLRPSGAEYRIISEFNLK
ncbi:MAG: RNA 2',3'-cyclic phosphodiesterase [Candidatus Aminicenantales bacterium]